MKKPTISKAVAARIRKALKERIGNGQEGLFPPHLDIVREASELEFNESDEMMYSALLESICGATDDSQPVEQYDGTLGVTTAFVAAHQSPVGQLQWNNNLATLYTNPGNVSGIRWCTGTLITNDLFLTAGHCFDQTGGGWIRPVDNTTGVTIAPAEIATNMHVNFNFQVDPAGVLRVEQSFPILNLVEYRLGGLDFAIVQLGGSPGAAWGIAQVATTDAVSGDMLCIIGHPAGWPKRIEAGPCLNVAGNVITYDDIDTLGGNSGSGVLRASDGRIVGVHTNGGCGPGSPGSGSNLGVRITSIIANSPTLQAITSRPTLKFIDDPNTIKFFDDHGTFKFVDDPTTIKFRDDINTWKFHDDINTWKFRDDINTLKFADDVGTNPFIDPGTSKAIDDVKAPALDKGFSDQKLPGTDGMPWGRPGTFGQPGAKPFVMSTPHHSMAWTANTAQQAGPAGEAIGPAAQYEQALVQIEEVMRQYMDALTQLDSEYQQILSEYQNLSKGTQG